MNPSDWGCSMKMVLPQQSHSFLFGDDLTNGTIDPDRAKRPAPIA